MTRNIKSIRDCYGCGVCAIACPKKIIRIHYNKNGFLEPTIIDDTKCIDCGICMSVCSYIQPKLARNCVPTLSGAAWSKDNTIRHICSSGGVAFEVSRFLITKGYNVCSVKYNPLQNQAEHYIAVSENELIPSIGSKYIQSYTVDGFNSIDRKKKHLVIGTPCQIDSLRRYIKYFNVENNFILIDFFCHGIPSKLMWDKYIHSVTKIVGKIKYVSWRNKSYGWHDSYTMSIDGSRYKETDFSTNCYHEIKSRKSQYNSKLSQEDPFLYLFLSDTCLGKACYYNCKYKGLNSSADIRIGDLWGDEYSSNTEGVNGVLVYSNIGEWAIFESNINFTPHPTTIITDGQLDKAPTRRKIVPFIFFCLRRKYIPLSNIKRIVKIYNSLNYWLHHPTKIGNKIYLKIKKK